MEPPRVMADGFAVTVMVVLELPPCGQLGPEQPGGKPLTVRVTETRDVDGPQGDLSVFFSSEEQAGVPVKVVVAVYVPFDREALLAVKVTLWVAPLLLPFVTEPVLDDNESHPLWVPAYEVWADQLSVEPGAPVFVIVAVPLGLLGALSKIDEGETLIAATGSHRMV